MADKNLVLQLLITAKDEASAGLQSVRTGLAIVGEAAAKALESLRSFGGALAAMLGFGSGKELLDRAEAYTRLSNALKIATTSEQGYQAALADVAAIAGRTNTDIETTAQLYGKVAQSAKELGLGQQQVGQLTEVISKGMQLSGASAEMASGAILQLTQAFSGGALRGEEFNSVMDASPELMRKLAAGLGVTIGELRGLAEQGALSARAVSAALLSQKGAIDQAYGETTKAVGQALTYLNNQLILYVGKLNESTGATATIGSALKLLADHLNIVAAAAGAGLVAALGKSALALVSYAREALAARDAARDHAIAAAAQREAAIASAQANVAAAQGAVNRAVHEQRLAAILLEEAMGEEAVARARAAGATAAQAATAATQRYSAAQVELSALQATTATSTGLLSRAMGFLAGPGGWILLAVSAFAALLPMLSGNKNKLDELAVSTDQYRESLKNLNATQLLAGIQKLNEGIQEQEDVVRAAEAQVNKLRDGHRNLYEVLKDSRPVAEQLTEAEGALAGARQKLTQLQGNLAVSEELLGKVRQQEDQDLGKLFAQYASVKVGMESYAKTLDDLGKQQQAVASADQERIAAELELAKAANDLQGVERLTLELARAKASAAQQQVELDRAAAAAAAIKLQAVQNEYDLIREKQPKDEEGLRRARQDVELKNAQATASQAVAAQLQAQVGAVAAVTNAQQAQLQQTGQVIAADERRAQAALAVAQAELQLAQAKGNQGQIAQAALAVAQAELAILKQQRAERQNDLEQYRQIAARIAELTARKGTLSNADAAELAALKEKHPNIIAEVGAREKNVQAIGVQIEKQQQEAQQAAVMAGPIGQLSRLYQEQVREHERAANATERYYDTQLKEVDAAIRVARAKGDETEAAKLLEKRQQILIEQAEAMAAIKATEAEDAQKAVEVKQMEAAATEGVSAAVQEEINKLQEVANAKKTAAQQAAIHADTLKKEAGAAKESGDAADEAAKGNDKVGKSADEATKKTEALTIAMIKFRGETATAFDWLGISRFNRLYAQVNDSIEQATLATKRLADEGIAAASQNAEWLANDLIGVEGALGDAAHTAGNDLKQALQQAREEAQGLAADIASMAENFQREILQMQGNQRALTELDYQAKLAKLEKLHQRAGQISDDEYQDAVSKLNTLHELKLHQLEAEARAKAASATNATSSGGSSSSGGGSTSTSGASRGPSVNNVFNIHVDGKDLLSEEQVRTRVVPILNRVTRLSA